MFRAFRAKLSCYFFVTFHSNSREEEPMLVSNVPVLHVPERKELSEAFYF